MLFNLMKKRKPFVKNNAIHTSQYTVLSFLPKTLFYQFFRFSNIYYFCIGIMQLFPSISDTAGVPTALLPLAVVLIVSALKDLAEDLRRHRSDAEENNRLVFVADHGCFIIKKWADLIVGDIVKIHRNESIPADLLILGTSGYSGIASVETKNLNGEANIERKIALPEVMWFFFHDAIVSHFKVKISYDPPSARLDEFQGILHSIEVTNSDCAKCLVHLFSKTHYQEHFQQLLQWDSPLVSPHACDSSVVLLKLLLKLDDGTEELEQSIEAFRKHLVVKQVGHSQPTCTLEQESKNITTSGHGFSKTTTSEDGFIIFKGPLFVDIGQFFLRGSTLVNTDWIYGLVLYVSSDTRIFRNTNNQKQFKWSHLEKTYNQHIIVLILLEFVFCSIIALAASLFHGKSRSIWYLGWYAEDKSPPSSFETFSVKTPESLFFTSFKVCLSMVILFAYFVPIDLFLLLEITRLLQGAFVNWDQDMMNKNDQATHAIAQSSHLLEELGHITHLFTDKTGTLTRNVMTLRSVSIGFQYLTSLDYVTTAQEDYSETDRGNNVLGYPLRLENPFSKITTYEWNHLLASLQEKPLAYTYARLFLLILSICHSILIREHCGATSSHELCDTGVKRLDTSSLPSFIEPQKIILERHPNDKAWTIVSPPLVEYDASSPDELALVCGAQTCGVEFFSRSSLNRIQLRLLTETSRDLMLGSAVHSVWKRWVQQRAKETGISFCDTEAIRCETFVPLVTFELLDVLEFDSVRKRMSVVIRDPLGDVNLDPLVYCDSDATCYQSIIRVLVKGADFHVFGAAASSETLTIQLVNNHLKKSLQDGFRTLVFALRNLSEQHYAELARRLVEARTRTFKDRCLASPKTSVVATSLDSSSLGPLINDLESELTIVGATGVEDELQKDVPEVIGELRSCGIKIWMLTGDKAETAINIGYSSKLISHRTYNFYIHQVFPGPLGKELKCVLEQCTQFGLIPNRKSGDSGEAGLQHSKKEPFFSVTVWAVSLWKKLRQHFRLKRTWFFSPPFQDPVKRHPNHVWSRWKRFRCYKSATRNTSIDPMSHFTQPGYRGFPHLSSRSQGTFDVGESPLDECCIRDKKSLPYSTTVADKFLSQDKEKSVLPCESSNVNYVSGSRITSNEPSTQSCPDSDSCVIKNACHLKKPSLVPDLGEANEFSLIVQGPSLEVILLDKELSRLFFFVAFHAVVVLACRVSPKQKASLVEMSSRFYPVCTSTLAIGDGANDVGMILSADVGVGIIGKEGLQAVRAADFGIKQFCFIRKLLFVHGREALRRNSFLIYYGIFKNIAFSIASFVFQFLCGFSGQDVYNYWFKSLYGTFFVAPTVLIYCIFDRQLPHYILQRSVITYHAKPPVVWPVIELPVVRGFFQYLGNLNQRLMKLTRHCLCFLHPPKPPKNSLVDYQHFQKRGTVPVGNYCYGTRVFFVWFVYGFYVGCIVCLVPLYILNHATSVDRKTFTRDKTLTKFFQNELITTNSIVEGKPGFDLYSVGMVVMFQCILVCNLVVSLAINSFFPLQVVVMIGNMLFFVALWALTMWQPTITNTFPSLNTVAGMFTMIWSCTSFYFTVFLLIFFCIVPLFTTKMLKYDFGDVLQVYDKVKPMMAGLVLFITLLDFVAMLVRQVGVIIKVMLNPSVISIVKERMLQGVFDVVVARRNHAAEEIVVFVPQRQVISPSTSADKLSLSQMSPDQPLNSMSSTRHESTIDQNITQPVCSCNISVTRKDPYAGFFSGYSETYTSSPPSLWTIATLASWLSKTMEPLFTKVGRGAKHTTAVFLAPMT